MLLALALLEIGGLLIYAGVTGRSPVSLLLGSNASAADPTTKPASPKAAAPVIQSRARREGDQPPVGVPGWLAHG